MVKNTAEVIEKIGVQTKNGLAFEYAVVIVLKEAISKRGYDIQVIDNAALQTAKGYFSSLSTDVTENMVRAAECVTEDIFNWEPAILVKSPANDLLIYLQSSQEGEKGDVRDVILERPSDKWKIGLSVKHNHKAVKHSRLSQSIDFGQKWMGTPCSREYFRAIEPVFNMLDGLERKGLLWRELEDKDAVVYLPVMTAFREELSRICMGVPEAIMNLLEYLIGKEDFYKIISVDSNKQTQVQVFKFKEKINCSYKGIRPTNHIKKLHYPKRIESIRFKEGSQSTVLVTFDMGWAVRFRIHNAESKILPSLKLDISIDGFPGDMVSLTRNWTKKVSIGF